MDAEQDKNKSTQPINWNERKRIVFGSIAITICFFLLFAIASLVELYILGTDDLRKIFLNHFIIIIGLPLAALFSFIIVILFVVDVEGFVTFKMFGLEFSGPGGPVILWAVAFLSIVGAFKILTI